MIVRKNKAGCKLLYVKDLLNRFVAINGSIYSKRQSVHCECAIAVDLELSIVMVNFSDSLLSNAMSSHC